MKKLVYICVILEISASLPSEQFIPVGSDKVPRQVTAEDVARHVDDDAGRVLRPDLGQRVVEVPANKPDKNHPTLCPRQSTGCATGKCGLYTITLYN